MQTEFVTLDLENSPARNAEPEGFKPVICEYAEKSFTCQGFVPVKFGPIGKTLAISLVLQKLQGSDG